MSVKSPHPSKPGNRDIPNSCTKVVNDGKAFRNYRLLKIQGSKHEKYGSNSNASSLSQSHKKKKLQQNNSKYKFKQFEKTVDNNEKSISAINKASKPINSSTVMANKELIRETISGSSMNVYTKKYNKTRGFNKRKHNKNYNAVDNSQKYIIGSIESILKDNEKFCSTPTKRYYVKKADKKSVHFTSKSKMQKIRFKKSIECIPTTNTPEQLTKSSLKQIAKNWTTNESQSKNLLSKNISLSSKRKIAKALFNGRSWIEGNKALEKSPQVNSSNLKSLLSKEILFKTNDEKFKKPLELPGEICTVPNSENIATYTKPELINDCQNKQIKTKTSTDLLQHNHNITNKQQDIIIKKTSKCSTDKESIFKNESETLPLNKASHFNKGETPFEFSNKKEIIISYADDTLKATPTNVTPHEPNLKTTRNSSSIIVCNKMAEPNLRLIKKESNPIKSKLDSVKTLDLKTTNSDLNLKYSKGTTMINKEQPVTETKNISNPLPHKTVEHNINLIQSNLNSGKQISTDTFQIKQQNTTCLQCYKKSDSADSKTYKYSKTAQKPLGALNNEIVNLSSLLPAGCNINNIWQCIYQQFKEIKKCDHTYNKLHSAKKTKLLSQSSPQLLKPSLPLIKNNNLLHALKLGLIQTQSENQVRLAVIPIVEEKTLHTSNVNHCSKTCTLQLEKKTNIVSQPITPEEKPILPKLIPVFETYNQPCTILKQQKKDMYNTPARLSTLKEELYSKSNKHSSVTPVNVFSTNIINKFNSDLETKIKQLTEATVQLDAVNLLRMRAQQNIHAKLVKECDATDSLIEFQRQMKPTSKVANKKSEVKDVQSRTSLKNINNKPKLLKIITEELFVPAKKINKIAATNLNPLVKTNSVRYKSHYCQFLYKESKKKQHRKQKKESGELNCVSSKTLQLFSKKKLKLKKKETQEKYSGSSLFSNKNTTKLNKNLSLGEPVSILNSTTDNTSHSIYELIPTISHISNNHQPDRLSQQAIDCKTGLDCFDILDEISLKDLKPLESEYPRKDHVPLSNYPCVQDTFLYKMVNNHLQDTFLDSLKYEETSIECKNKNCKLCNSLKDVNIGTSDFPENKKKGQQLVSWRNRQSNLPNNQQSLIQNKALTNGNFKKHLEIPLTTNKIKLEAKLHRRTASTDGSIQSSRNTNKKLNKNKQHAQSKIKKTQKLTQDDVIAKLRKYMFDPRMLYPTTITVMPVSVTTTYTNPNFIQNIRKHSSGDCASSNQPGSDKYSSKPPPRDKEQLKNVTTKHAGKPLSEKKLWNNKYPKTASNNLITYLEKQNCESSHQKADDVSNSNQISGSTQKSIRNNQSPRIQPDSSTTYNQQYKTQQSFFINSSSQLNTGIIEQVPQLRTSSMAQQQKVTKTPKFTSQQTRKILNPTITIHTLKDENINTQNKTFHKKNSLENNIQNVIDMIEGKIVDIISSPDQIKVETFDNVEKEIVGILQKIKGNGSKHLEAIKEQDLSPRPRKDEKEIKKKNEKRNCQVKTTKKPSSINVINNLERETCPYVEITQKENDNTSDLFNNIQSPSIASNEEHFVITSSCFPNNPKTLINSDTNKNKSDLHVKGKTSLKCKKEKPVSQVIPPSNNDKTPTNKDSHKAEEIAVCEKNDEIQNYKREEDQFLSPFMKTLKKYRKDDHSINVLEFLDALTNISDDVPLKSTNKCGMILYYRHKFQIAQVFHQSEAFYPIYVYHTVVYSNRDSICKSLNITELNIIKKLFLNFNLFKIFKCPCNANVICYDMDHNDKSLLQNNSLNILNQKQMEIVQPIINDNQHFIFLNSFYGMLFIAIFLSLTFNYTCQ